MTPVELSRSVLRAMRRAVDDGELRDVGMPERVIVERPRPGGRGDYATNVALQVARAAGRPPMQVAEILSPRLTAEPGIASIDITGPGFLNITLTEGDDTGSSGAALVRDVRDRGACYGHVHPDTGARHQLHFPREVRAAVLADTLRRILRSQGALVRVTCDEAPDPGWTTGLGVRVDAHGKPPVPLNTLRPVPAPQDPTPLGRDAARWALLYPAGHDRPRIEPAERHLAQRESNPLFRVRYAYARTRALSRNAEALGFDAAPGDVQDVEDVQDGQEARDLLDAIGDHPRVLAAAARRHAPDCLARHLVTTADAFLAFQPSVLPRGDEKPLAAHRARLALAEAAGTVLAGGLSLLGISAPEHL
ncbi:DALR anticodon-binding domain-containing protein [Streptomyces sp. NBC_01381]|uniref:ArgS-related anticodon-binding protein NrtL n=1 Tax=Streptomyces sp. NBC_01381 TaxID=2903845 RepID=UPI00224D5227|nr:DALR anticodon-binding domain-containing protein [Streptomyces sp. NBC_01381]MCX4669989.1 DALR anticodon-binding domain-containing protein [Streptomyces sp. NBC_01381]